MKTFSRDWNMFTAGFVWAFACGAFLSLVVCSWSFSKGQDREQEKTCPDPLVEMAEYRTVVHSLDRCSNRLDEEQQDNFQMKDSVDHWTYIARLTHTVDEEINCMLLIEKATRDFREVCEDDLYVFQAAVDEACWCPYEAEHWWWQ